MIHGIVNVLEQDLANSRDKNGQLGQRLESLESSHLSLERIVNLYQEFTGITIYSVEETKHDDEGHVIPVLLFKCEQNGHRKRNDSCGICMNVLD